MHSYGHDRLFVVDEGILSTDDAGRPQVARASTLADVRSFRFSRMSPKGAVLDRGVLLELADALRNAAPHKVWESLPIGQYRLAQFVRRDLTLDLSLPELGVDRIGAQSQSGSPKLDLSCLYGAGSGTGQVPVAPGSHRFSSSHADASADLRDIQTLALFIQFHHRVADVMRCSHNHARLLFEAARREVVLHYHWLLRHDFLPRIVDPAVVDDVFANGRQFFEVTVTRQNRQSVCRGRLPGDTPTMPLEFALGAYQPPTRAETASPRRNLLRANMVRLASGQQVAAQMGIPGLTEEQILPSSFVMPPDLSRVARTVLVESTPLWFYTLREADLAGGRMTGVGGRIVAETFHRAMEGSQHSIVREPTWRPQFGPDGTTFGIVDLEHFLTEGDESFARLGVRRQVTIAHETVLRAG